MIANMNNIRETNIYKRLYKMYDAKEALVVDPIALLEYWEILSPQVKVNYLKELSKTRFGLTFRGIKITTL